MSELQEVVIKLTNDVEIEKLSYYNLIIDVISSLEKNGILNNLHGNCIAAADMITAMLHHKEIESYAVECQVSIQTKDPNGNVYYNLVGYDNTAFHGQVDTHLVIVTKTPIPILIDVSISQFLPQTHPFIIERVDNLDPNILGNYKFDNVSLLYQIKKNIRLPSIHQKTVLEKVNDEVKLKSKIKFLTMSLSIVLGITLFNMFANIGILLLKFL